MNRSRAWLWLWIAVLWVLSALANYRAQSLADRVQLLESEIHAQQKVEKVMSETITITNIYFENCLPLKVAWWRKARRLADEVLKKTFAVRLTQTEPRWRKFLRYFTERIKNRLW